MAVSAKDQNFRVQPRISGPEFALHRQMHLYNLTLQTPTAITQAVVGNFSGARQQEIIISRGTRLELVRPDPQSGKLATVIATDVFGSIRSLASFRLTGGTKGETPVRILCLLPLTLHLFRLRRSRLRFWTHHCSRLRSKND